MRNLCALSTIFVLAFSVACNGVSEEQKAALGAQIDAAETFSDQLESTRVAALNAFLDEPAGAPAECPEGLLRDEERSSRGGRRAAQNLTITLVSDLNTELSPRADQARSAFTVNRGKLEPSSMIAIENKSQLERAQAEVALWADNEWWPYEVTYLITHRRVPRTTAPGTFEPGYIAGWVVAWSYADSRIVCAFELREDTPDGVTLEDHPDTTQEQELLFYLRARVTTRIRQALGNL